jgi:hypothetical protein
MSELLNLVGLSTGVVLYTMLLVMVVRAWRPTEASRFDPLLLATALLGLIWNLCALPAYELPKVGIQGPFPFLIAAGYSALGFLPAVVVHSVLRDEREGASGSGWPKRIVAGAAYAVSGLAAALHAHAAWTGDPLPSAFGMRLLTYSFIALVVPLAAVTRRQPGARRLRPRRSRLLASKLSTPSARMKRVRLACSTIASLDASSRSWRFFWSHCKGIDTPTDTMFEYAEPRCA